MRPVLVTLTLPRKCFFCLKTHDTEQDTTARFGRFKLCRDDQGSGFGLHEPPAGAG